jgi:hypothetical protein
MVLQWIHRGILQTPLRAIFSWMCSTSAPGVPFRAARLIAMSSNGHGLQVAIQLLVTPRHEMKASQEDAAMSVAARQWQPAAKLTPVRMTVCMAGDPQTVKMTTIRRRQWMMMVMMLCR